MRDPLPNRPSSAPSLTTPLILIWPQILVVVLCKVLFWITACLNKLQIAYAGVSPCNFAHKA